MGKDIDDILADLKGESKKKENGKENGKEKPKKGGVMNRKNEKSKTVENPIVGFIPVRELIFSEHNRPVDEKKVDELIESIKHSGLLIPIIINPEKEILDGERRVRACMGLGIKEVPFIVKKDMNLDEVMVISNYIRDNLSFEQVKEIVQREEGTQKQVAKKFGISQARISQILKGVDPETGDGKFKRKAGRKQGGVTHIRAKHLPENVKMVIFKNCSHLTFVLDMEMEKDLVKNVTKLLKEIKDFPKLLKGRKK